MRRGTRQHGRRVDKDTHVLREEFHGSIEGNTKGRRVPLPRIWVLEETGVQRSCAPIGDVQ